GSRHAPPCRPLFDPKTVFHTANGTGTVPATMMHIQETKPATSERHNTSMIFELFDPRSEFVVREGANLPHWYQPGVTYFVTFRTEDSIPADVADLAPAPRRLALSSRHRCQQRAVAKLAAATRSRRPARFPRDFLARIPRSTRSRRRGVLLARSRP